MFKLSNIRRLLAFVVFAIGTLFILQMPFLHFDFFVIFPKMQMVPAILAGSIFTIIALLLGTILFGRLYCSVICPLGILQDLIIRIKRKLISKNKELRKKRRKHQYEKPQNILRYAVLIIAAVSLEVGSTFVLIFFDPYSIYTRLSVGLFHPLGITINNLLAKVFNFFDSYAVVTEHYIVPSVFTLIISGLITATIVILTIKKDRFWCNAICPVGTLLGIVSKISLFRVVVNQSKCVSCGKCSMECKSHAIDNTNGFKIDYTRCISCYNCIDTCDKKQAINLVPVSKLKKLSCEVEQVEK